MGRVVDNIVLYTWKLLGVSIYVLCFIATIFKKRIYCANIPLSIKITSSSQMMKLSKFYKDYFIAVRHFNSLFRPTEEFEILYS